MSVEEDIELILDDSKASMQKSLDALIQSMSQVRSGRATTGLVEDIKIDVYGQIMPLNQVATINIPEARLITIDVWDKSNLQNVEKGIMASGRNLNPQNDGILIRINLPELTEERRKEMVKIAKQKVEDHKVSVRNIRRESNDELKKLKESGMSEDSFHEHQDNIQKITDGFVSKIDTIFFNKEKEIMTI